MKKMSPLVALAALAAAGSAGLGRVAAATPQLLMTPPIKPNTPRRHWPGTRDGRASLVGYLERYIGKPSFLTLIRAATTRDELNDILMTAQASNASRKTLRRLEHAFEHAYDARKKELGV